VQANTLPAFGSFMQAQGRLYKTGSPEYVSREALYNRRLQEAKLHNSNPNRKWTAAINLFSDWTERELAMLFGWNGHGMQWAGNQESRDTSSGRLALALTQEVLPEHVSWQNLTATQTAIDQGGCGSCWAVTAATVLNAHAEKVFGPNKRTFSAQQLVDCVPNPQECGGKGGCDGATVELAFEYVFKYGLATEKQVPYTGSGSKCQRSQSFMQTRPAGKLFKMRSWKRLPENKYQPLMQAVAQKGPVGVSVGANGWTSYSSGIFDACEKDVVINHAVTLIGYGKSDKGDKFWLIQNSWGGSWGENGRIRLLRRDTDEKECGIDDKPSDGTGCKGGPPKVKVCGMCGVLYDTSLPVFAA